MKHHPSEFRHGICYSARMASHLRIFPVILLGWGAFTTFACSQAKQSAREDEPLIGSTSFTSPAQRWRESAGADDGGGLSYGGTASAPVDGDPSSPGTDEGGESPERVVSEADILKVDGTKLYALSRYSGLSVIDISNPSKMRLLGRHQAFATPFEMYIEGQRAYVMYNDWGSYSYDALNGYYTWKITSRIQALDLSDAANIKLIGEKDIAGSLSDSRKVGDVLYLVTYENGSCWECESTSNTHVLSFDVKNPDEFQLIDELRIRSTKDYIGQRSISVTPQRIYVSGWSWDGSAAGAVDVVDISDAAGDLKRGASFAIAGPVESRWQMDEYDGVLRVISQPGGWGNQTPPVLQTFSVTSSTKIDPLASLDLVLPRPEDLRSARFDGDKAYAITFERTDPLFTFDLSDPAHPLQKGELEIPGWVYHMEPRGDRIYALGFENENNAGSLHVSLFDVSNLEAPTQISRVNFGGSWANFAEDQDRIHKAFNILEDTGLILVPFSGWDYSDSPDLCWGEYQSGIQLVDMTRDSLTLRGVAPQIGDARRGFLQGDTLFGISDNAVQTFDISDRDAPSALGKLDVARNVSRLVVLGDNEAVLRFGSDWWTQQATLDFTSVDAATTAPPLGELDLSSKAAEERSCESYAFWNNEVYVHDGYAYIPRTTYVSNSQKLTIYALDIRDLSHPTLVSETVLEASDNSNLGSLLKTDKALLVNRVTNTYDRTTGRGERFYSYEVLSLENPEKPKSVSTITLPASYAFSGYGANMNDCVVDMPWGFWGAGAGGALVSGDFVASQHYEIIDNDSGQRRYFLDRIDVSDPAKPRLLAPVNIPGSVASFDHSSGRLVTLDYVTRSYEMASSQECRGYREGNTCVTYQRAVNILQVDDKKAVLRARKVLETNFNNNVAVSSSRLFVLNFNDDRAGSLDAYAIGDGIESLGRAAYSGAWGNLFARGDRAFVVSAGVMTSVDAKGADDFKVKDHEMNGSWCSALEVHGDRAYCALGYNGVQSFELD